MSKPSDLKLTEQDKAEIISVITSWQTNKPHTISELKSIFSSVSSHIESGEDKGIVGKINKILEGLDVVMNEKEEESGKAQYVTITTGAGTLTAEQLQTLNNNVANRIYYENAFYVLVVRNGNQWTYAAKTSEDGKMEFLKLNVSTGSYSHSDIDLKAQIDAHKNNTAVHVQNGERNNWNNKVSASISGEALVLE